MLLALQIQLNLQSGAAPVVVPAPAQGPWGPYLDWWQAKHNGLRKAKKKKHETLEAVAAISTELDSIAEQAPPWLADKLYNFGAYVAPLLELQDIKRKQIAQIERRAAEIVQAIHDEEDAIALLLN